MLIHIYLYDIRVGHYMYVMLLVYTANILNINQTDLTHVIL